MDSTTSAIAGLTYPILIGDIGGTNARFAILKDSHSDPVFFPVISTEVCESLDEAIQLAVLDQTSVHPSSALLAVAGMVAGDQIELTNRGWTIQPQQMLETLRLESIIVINDFEAQALAVLSLPPDDMEQIGGGDADENAPCAVLGPGTGLGVAGLVQMNGAWIPIAGEGGHVDIGPRTDRENAIFKYLESADGRISAEQVLSGRGILNLYRAICQADGSSPSMSSPAEISTAALANENAEATEALELFAVLLGRVAGDMALIFKSSGGVYLTGGIARKILPALQSGAFREAFEDKAPHREFLAGVQVKVVMHPLAALVGIANFARSPEQFCVDVSSRHWSRAAI